MVLCVPFYLGASHKPYFFLLEVLIYGNLVIGFFHLWKRKTPIAIPFKPLILLLAFSYLFSLPINSKEYYYELWVTPWKELWNQWLSGHEKFIIFHLRSLFNHLSGLALFILVVNLFLPTDRKPLEKVFQTMLWMAFIVSLLGTFILFGILPSQPKTFLSLSLIGIHEGALSAFAFNRQYLAQYLLVLLPFLFYFLFINRRKIVAFIFYLLVSGTLIFSISATMQRSAYLILFLGTLFFILGYIFLISKKKKPALLLVLIPILILAGVLLVDILFLNHRFLDRLAVYGLSDPENRRIHLWQTAWHMFQFSPLLGVGLGEYTYLFPEFYKSPFGIWKTYGVVRGEAHSFYLQMLAEQGGLGLLLLMGLLAAIFHQLVSTIKKNPILEMKMLTLSLMTSLISWLLLGFFHNVSYVRSLGVLLWILLGWSVSLIAPLTAPDISRTKPPCPAQGRSTTGHENRSGRTRDLKLYFRIKTKGFLVGLLILTAAFGYQLKLIYDRPLPPFFQAGLYKREVLPGGEKVRWMGKKAVINTNIQAGAAIIHLSAPLPEIEKHAQRIRLWAGKHFQEMTIKDTQWHQIILPMDKKTPGWTLLKIETDHTFNPQKSKISRDDRDLGVMIRGID
ncbi:MAG: O-antigen ligase family protein [Pseudomonadota bacterium]